MAIRTLRAKRGNRVPSGPFYKQRGWISSAAFLGVLLAMSAASLATGDGDAGAPTARDILAEPPGPLSPDGPDAARRGPGERPQGCRTDDRGTTKPKSVPPDVKWRKLLVVMVPTSPSAGPLRTDGAMWWCFARTPMGAVLAAHVIPTQMSGTDWRTVADQQLVPGAARDVFVTRKSALRETSPKDRAVGRYTGFSVSSYTREAATVRLLISNPMGGYASTSVSVRWRDGDWKVQPTADGSLYSRVTTAARPSSFVVWGA